MSWEYVKLINIKLMEITWSLLFRCFILFWNIFTEPPVITVNPSPFLSLSKDDALNNYVSCEAEHYSEIEWYREEGLFNYWPTEFGAGKFLNLSTSFTFVDQGNYLCVAKGTGEFASRYAYMYPSYSDNSG